MVGIKIWPNPQRFNEKVEPMDQKRNIPAPFQLAASVPSQIRLTDPSALNLLIYLEKKILRKNHISLICMKASLIT